MDATASATTTNNIETQASASASITTTINNIRLEGVMDTTAPVISNVAAGGITPTSATITWTTNENSDSQVEYGTTTAYGQSTTLNPALVTAHSRGLSGLTPGTQYHYRVKSRDATGNLAFSGDFTFTTAPPPDTIAPVISNVVAGGITATGATITWNTNENSDSQVEYGTTTAYGQSTTLNSALVTAHSQGLSGLTSGTQYHYRVKSRDAAGNLAVSGDHTFTTNSVDTTAPVISSVAAIGITPTGATITWTTDENSDSQVEYGTTTDYGQSTTLNPGLVTAHSQGLSGLTSGTVYHYRVKSRDAAGNLAVSGDYTFVTYSLNMALIDPINHIGSPGKDLFSRNCNWSLPLLSLPGRAGLDLGLALSLNSLIYTRAGSTIHFDPDHGFPAPGFRLGFPEIRNAFTNTDAGAQSYLLSMPSGSRVEFRQINTNVYEAVDSSYMQLTHDPVNMVFILRTTDGTQLRFEDVTGLGDYKCVQIKDRHGNFITIGYGSLAEIRTITDPLGRVINFNYDPFNHLLSITQNWGGQTHTWATFAYGTQTIQTNFPGLTLSGTANDEPESVLLRVGLADGTVYSFEYNTYAQVKTIRRWAPNNSNPVNFPGDYSERAHTTYGLPVNASASQTDCPRATFRTDWAYDWNQGVPVTSFYTGGPDWGQVEFPDGTKFKEFFATTGWQRGLTTQTENWAGGVRKKWTTLLWTQDNTGVSYRLNPRVMESNVYDDAGNRRRTTTSYTSFGLPSDVYEYDANATTVLRHTHTDYNLSAVYTSRRIIGLPSARFLKDGSNNLFSKVTFEYDQNPNPYLQHPGQPVQHDTANYGPGFVQGRGNLNVTRRWDVTDQGNPSLVSENKIGYNTSGSVSFTRDPLDHPTSFSYADSFSDGQNDRNTYAYPTTITINDPNEISSTVQYNYDFGAVTRTENAKGAAVTRTYDAAGRIERITNVVNGAYTRYVYAPDQRQVETFTTINDLNPANEFRSVTVFDGHDRVKATRADHPGSVGLYKAQLNVYDIMGRLAEQSNPTEVNSSWQPAGDDAAAGWIWSSKAYDWQGRLTLSTNQEEATSSISYEGCGCAGGQKVVLIDAGRRREQNFDILGRMWRERTYIWGGSNETGIYSTTTNTYNIRDQITNVSVTDNGTAVSQNTVMTYDGHGRLQSRRLPIETAATTYDYKSDDTLNWVIDARGAKSQFSYNNRKQVASVTYSDTSGSGLIATPSVSFQYDELGNRTLMDDGPGSVSYGYNSLGRLTSETRTFDMPGAPAGQFTIGYQYGLGGQLTRITDPFGAQIDYTYDKSMRLTRVTGTDFAGITTYIDNVTYRAWGSAKSVTYGIYNGTQVAQMNYNALMLPTHYELGSQVSVNYGYSDFGRLFQVTGLSDPKLNQSFGYDHQGRLSSATANGGGVAPTQYNLTYTYDAFGNTVHRGISYWYTSSFGVAATYENDKMITANEAGTQQRFFYDQSGNTLYSEKQNPLNGVWSLADVYRYDMRGQVVGVSPVSPTNPEQTRFHDGNGAEVALTGGSFPVYYLRSSVLEGRILTTILNSGQKLTTEVFAGKEIIATQCVGCVVFGVNMVNFHRRDPQRTLDLSNGNVYMMDPLGIRVQPATQEQINGGGGQNPPPVNPGNYYAASLIDTYGHSDHAMKCRLDGTPVPCDRLLRAAAKGELDRRVTVSTTGGMGGVGGGTGAIMGAFWLAAGQAESTMRARFRRVDGQEVGLTIGGETTVWDTPPKIEIVLANDVNFFFGQDGGQQGGVPKDGSPPERPRDKRHMLDDCQYMAAFADELAANAYNDNGFVIDFKKRFVTPDNKDSPEMREFRSDGFKPEFHDNAPWASYNQVRHFAGGFSNAYVGGLGARAAAAVAFPTLSNEAKAAIATAAAVKFSNDREGPTEFADKALNRVSGKMGVMLAFGLLDRKDIGSKIRQEVCTPRGR